MFDFSGKTALITGASGGIGAAVTKLLHAGGAHVIISGSNAEKLETFAQELGGNYTIHLCDLADKAAVDSLINAHEKIDILVCNAGITKDNLSLRMSLEDFNEVIDINLATNFLLNKLAIKKMLKARTGRIINISSVVAFSGNPGQANYCASKAGLVGMTKALAAEVAAKEITINAVAPGFITTKMTDKLNEEQKNALLNKIPMKRFGLADDVAGAVAFLASDLASYITGQTIHVNGGMLMV